MSQKFGACFGRFLQGKNRIQHILFIEREIRQIGQELAGKTELVRLRMILRTNNHLADHIFRHQISQVYSITSFNKIRKRSVCSLASAVCSASSVLRNRSNKRSFTWVCIYTTRSMQWFRLSPAIQELNEENKHSAICNSASSSG